MRCFRLRLVCSTYRQMLLNMQNSSKKMLALPIKETNPQPAETVIEMRNVSTSFGEHVVHTDINLAINRAEIFAIIGGSGSGKSTLLREMILLQRPNTGSIQILGIDLKNINDDDALTLRKRWGG